MSIGTEGQGPDLEQFRQYLMMLARLHWDQRLQDRMDVSDVVQQTLLEAHQRLGQFRGTSDRELAGWLRTSLAHNLQDALKKVQGRRGDGPREALLLDAALEESSSRLEALLAADQSTPSALADRNEQFTRLAAALDQLPPPQREAVTLHHLQGVSLADLARRLDRTEASVAGLLRRVVKRLRELLREPE